MKLWVLGVLCSLSVSAYGDGLFRLESPRVRETLPGQSVSSAYFVAINESDKDIVLVAAGSDRSPRVEFHEHRHENGMMQMRKLESVTLPAGGQRVFETGGLHLMLLDLPAPLKAGEDVAITLTSATGGAVTVIMPVQSLQQTMQPAHHHH